MCMYCKGYFKLSFGSSTLTLNTIQLLEFSGFSHRARSKEDMAISFFSIRSHITHSPVGFFTELSPFPGLDPPANQVDGHTVVERSHLFVEFMHVFHVIHEDISREGIDLVFPETLP